MSSHADLIGGVEDVACAPHSRGCKESGTHTVRRMRRANKLPEPSIGGRHPRWRRTDIDAWFAPRAA
jgi:hypothetical protein